MYGAAKLPQVIFGSDHGAPIASTWSQHNIVHAFSLTGYLDAFVLYYFGSLQRWYFEK